MIEKENIQELMNRLSEFIDDNDWENAVDFSERVYECLDEARTIAERDKDLIDA